MFVDDPRIHYRALGNRAANSPFGNAGKKTSGLRLFDYFHMIEIFSGSYNISGISDYF